MTSTEEFIQQKEFQSPWHKLRVNLLITSNWLKNEIKEFLDQFEITQQQYNILRILRGAKGEPLSTNEICDRMIDKMSDTSRIVDRLVAKNLAEKSLNPQDKRKIQVFISSKGKCLLANIDEQMHALDTKFNHLLDEETEQLNDLLEKLRG